VLLEKYSRLYNVFLIQFIEEYWPKEDQPPLLIPDLKDEDKWEIKEVKDKGVIRDQVHYLVK